MSLESMAWLVTAVLVASGAAVAEESVTPPVKEVVAEEVVVSEKVTNTISLDKAIQKAIDNSPRLKSAASARQATQGERQQAGVRPNPAISVQAENIAGRGDYKGADAAELTFGVSQLIEIGGKRSARIGVADKGMTLAELEVEAARLNLMRDVTIAYAEAVAAQEQVKIAQEQKNLAAEVLGTVTKRVNAAASPLYQKSKAAVANSTSIIALDKAEREVTIAKAKLAALWGDTGTNFDLDRTDFFSVSQPEPLTQLNDLVKNNPDYMRWDTELERKDAAVDLEKANAIPDPSVNVGVRDFRETGDQAFVIGVSLPIPVFNSNQGNISKAHYESLKTQTDRDDARIELTTRLNRIWQQLQNSYEQSESLKKTIIPSAEESFKLARHGYSIGKFPYLEVLDAQRTLFETREQYNSSLKEYHVSRAEVERLIAKNKQSPEVSNEE